MGNRVFALSLGALFFAVSACAAPVSGQAGQRTGMQDRTAELQKLAPARGYLDAHKGVRKPLGLLGGTIKVHIAQDTGGVFVGLPSQRKLDPTVFGPANLPRHYGGTPIITGVPPMLRIKKHDGSFETKVLTPFGDKHLVVPNGKLTIDAVDATATDAAVTDDQVRMSASWKDKAGNTYRVKCCVKLAAHGLEYPTFGGVVTNIILHGFTSIGTPLMPSEFTYFAFWGFGEVEKNGKVLDRLRLIHGMLTEYVREEGYALGFDRDVTPGRRHFHLMVPPMKPVPTKGVFQHSPVNTGFMLPNGKELPFWHVMFENLKIRTERG